MIVKVDSNQRENEVEDCQFDVIDQLKGVMKAKDLIIKQLESEAIESINQAELLENKIQSLEAKLLNNKSNNN